MNNTSMATAAGNVSTAQAAIEIQRILRCSTTFAEILALRGVGADNLQDFLHPRIESLTDPFALKDMDKAVARIIEAVKNKEKIVVYSDYDVDGTTAGFILEEAFRWLKVPVDVHIPHRVLDGYGVQINTLRKMKEDGVRLVISVDCGIRSFEEVKWAKDNGIDFIVTDHHQPDGDKLPPATAVVNPHRADCNAGGENLTGVGVAFKLAQALLSKSKISYNLKELLPFVALGMMADMTAVVGEARTIVKLGFDEIFNSPNLGLRALCDTCVSGDNLSSVDVGYSLAPRINAAGRLGEPDAVIDLFNSRTEDEARRLALRLDCLNDDRKKIQHETIELAIDAAEDLIIENKGNKPDFIVLSGFEWHRGVIGIVASQIVSRYGKPVLVFSEDEDGLLTGSGRTYGDFPLLEALESCAELFETFGGHKAACGARLDKSRLAELRRRLNDFARKIFAGDFEHPEIRADMELKPDQITLQLAKELQMLEPFGQGNREPLFRSFFKIGDLPQILKNKHLKYALPNGDGDNTVTALHWGGQERYRDVNWDSIEAVEAIFRIEINEWRGKSSVQIVIVDSWLH